jgi:hypothetical protein
MKPLANIIGLFGLHQQALFTIAHGTCKRLRSYTNRSRWKIVPTYVHAYAALAFHAKRVIGVNESEGVEGGFESVAIVVRERLLPNAWRDMMIQVISEHNEAAPFEENICPAIISVNSFSHGLLEDVQKQAVLGRKGRFAGSLRQE